MASSDIVDLGRQSLQDLLPGPLMEIERVGNQPVERVEWVSAWGTGAGASRHQDSRAVPGLIARHAP